MNLKLKHVKYIFIVTFLLILIIQKGSIVNIFSNIRSLTQKNSNNINTEINILKDNIDYLTKELFSLNDTFSKKEYKYNLSKISYFDPYNKDIFYIYNGENKKYKKNYILRNEYGAIGIIDEVYENYSKCKLLTSVNNISVVINNSYGLLSEYKDGKFIITDISNYDKISLNDKVYTSAKGIVNEEIYIGTVKKIENKDIEKIIYVESEVDFNNINYLYVIGDV